MVKLSKDAPVNPDWDSETNLLAWLATCISVLSFLFYYRYAEIVLYGDAVAHINIARRVIDSKTPGLLQLGTVWLPLPHLLMIPFLFSTQLWRTSAGGSLPSMAAYVFGVIGIFRLVRGVLPKNEMKGVLTRLAPWAAAFAYASNPNVIYMQATAMGEAIYLAIFIWAIVYLSEFARGDLKALTKCGWCLFGACLTRYDGWFLAVCIMVLVLSRIIFAEKGTAGSKASKRLRIALAKFIFLAAAGPLLWFAYNGIIYRNPLEFENGPYSAKAIERRTQSSGNPGHPGTGNPMIAGMYFVKSAESNVAHNEWLQRTWILLLVATVAAVPIARRRWNSNHDASSGNIQWIPLIFLLAPIPFYALSISYGGVPIFIPYWWPFTHYNVRYGLQLLPALAVSIGLLVYFLSRLQTKNPVLRAAAPLSLLVLVVGSYLSVWQATPICLEEARVNMRTRNQFQAQLATWIEKLPQDSTLLMYLGDHVGAVERAGFPLKHTINEGNHRVWMQPRDEEGLWERALADPAKYADYVLAFDGDPVWQAVKESHLHELVEIHVTGQARAVLYRAR